MDNAFTPSRHVTNGVKLTDSFWDKQLRLYRDVTFPDVLKKFEREQIQDNFTNLVEGKREHHWKPFSDSFFYQMIYAAGEYARLLGPDPALEAKLDRYIDTICAAQDAVGTGFISTKTDIECPHCRFGENGGDLIFQHDLCNMGMLIEAGVHYYLATGKTKLLGAAVKCANYLADTIGPAPKKNIVPGHPDPEGALVELYELALSDPGLSEKLCVPVRPEAYLELLHTFVHFRGRHEDRTNYPRYMGEYAVDHAPIEEQYEAVGHAVRAVMYYRGAAGLARLESDGELLGHVQRLYDSIEYGKLYINGGVGVLSQEEKFSIPYDLPNTGYMETCGTIGLIMLSAEMNKATSDARYYQVIESGLYNIMLNSVSQTGDRYLYQNAMVSDGTDHRWTWHPCPCCPPMILKFFGGLDRLIYSEDDEGLFVNLFISSEVSAGGFELAQHCNYPAEGNIIIDIASAPGGNSKLRLRLPAWCAEYKLSLNGQAAGAKLVKGYLELSGQFKAGDRIELELEMPATRVQAHPYIKENNGRVAIRRGPVLYCIEGTDNHDETDPVIAQDWRPEVEYDERLFGGAHRIRFNAADGTPINAIPYWLWDNHATGAMRVWLKQDGCESAPIAGEEWKHTLYRQYD